jgi:hypothetical protein
MIEQTLQRITEQIEKAPIPAGKKNELEALLGELRTEVAGLARTDHAHAESIIQFAGLSAHEAMRPAGPAELQRISLEGLAATVDGFEATHPRLASIVNSLCVTLSNLGI